MREALEISGLSFAGFPHRVYRPKVIGVRKKRTFEDWSELASQVDFLWNKRRDDVDPIVVAVTSEPLTGVYSKENPPPEVFWVGVSKHVYSGSETTDGIRFDIRITRLTKNKQPVKPCKEKKGRWTGHVSWGKEGW